MNIIAILEATLVISMIILAADYLDSAREKRESAIEKILARLFSKKK